MRPPLDGTVLLTGASAGIGTAMAHRFATRAKRLILVARREQRLHALATTLRQAHPTLEVDVMPCDLADDDAVDALVDAVGAVDVLVNNAGLGDLGLFEASDLAKTDTMLRVNILGLTRLTRGLVPGMVARGRGGILMVSSSYGLTWTPGAAAYIGSKHYVTAFSEVLRSELRGAGVVVSQLNPGPVDTEFEEQAGSFYEGWDPPRFVFMSADAVARVAYDGFARGRAIIVPGLAMKLTMWAAAFTPRWLFRLLYAPMATSLRRHHRKVKARGASS